MITAINFDQAYLQNKTICLVGNSKNLLNQNYANEIDAHDIVCRINDALENTKSVKYSKFYGKKTDVLFINMFNPIRMKLIERHKPRIIIHMTPVDDLPSGMVWDMYTKDNLDQLVAKLNTTAKPSTGIRCLDYLEQTKFQQIDVYGFDWKALPSFIAGKNDISAVNHDFNNERDYCMKNFFYPDSRFVLHS